MIAGRPRGSAVPTVVRTLAAGGPTRPVWENELGGLTFEVGTGAHRCFIKWSPRSCGPDLAGEAARLAWAGAFHPVPRLLDHGADDTGSWLVTAPLDGQSAVSNRWKADPATAVAAIGEGLRALHDTLSVETCPFSWSVEDRLADIHTRSATPGLQPARWEPDHQRLGVDGALEVLSQPPPIDRLVVCHGDACAPNTLIGDDGTWTGHVDLGQLGVADRWADLAVATWSTHWNYGPGWEQPLLAAYGITADHQRISYYRLLWDLGP